MIDFQTDPSQYKHWRLEFDGPVAILTMDVDEDSPLGKDYQLKLNSYDLGVDIELFDAIQRLRFEHPEIGAVILTSGKERLFCAGANIRMLAGSSHDHKVNFCKFTNETRNSIEDAIENSHQRYLCVINGPCAGGGYELAMACDYIMMSDDRNTSVALPEVPLLAVLPGTGGLTRLVDKRKVRRDRADFFCTTEEGVKGQRAVDWRLVDEVVPASELMDTALERAKEFAGKTDRPSDGDGVELSPLKREIKDDTVAYETLGAEIDRSQGVAHITVRAPDADGLPKDAKGIHKQGVDFWPLKFARELDDFVLHMRLNEQEVGLWSVKTEGDPDAVEAADKLLEDNAEDWLVREIRLFLKRTLKRLDLTSRTLYAIIEPGSCFTGTLLELSLAADRTYMLEGQFEGDNRPPASVRLTPMNFGAYPMANDLTRLQARHLADESVLGALEKKIGEDLEAEEASEAGIATFTPDDIDWEDEVRLAIEERSVFSPDALTGMEANLRFPGPETMESKIFARLSAWQNWIFQRPNAVGERGGLRVYGTGQRPEYDKRRV